MCKLRLRKSCRTEHAGNLSLHAKVQKCVNCLRHTEIYHYICRNITLCDAAKHRICIFDMIRGIHPCGNLNLWVGSNDSCDHLPHFPIAAM